MPKYVRMELGVHEKDIRAVMSFWCVKVYTYNAKFGEVNFI